MSDEILTHSDEDVEEHDDDDELVEAPEDPAHGMRELPRQTVVIKVLRLAGVLPVAAARVVEDGRVISLPGIQDTPEHGFEGAPESDEVVLMKFVVPIFIISIERLEHEVESHCEGAQEDEVDEEDVENILDNFLYRDD